MRNMVKRTMLVAATAVLLFVGSIPAFAGCVTTTTTVTHKVFGVPVYTTVTTVTVCTS